MKISLIQAGLLWEDAEGNRRRFAEMIGRAPRADVFILPEMFTTGFSTDPRAVVELADTVTLQWMRDMARSKNAAVAGSVAVTEGGNLYNRFYFVLPDGNYHAYDKRHLFSMGGEGKRFTPGSERVLFEYQGFRIMPLVCYDLRFPAWARCAGECDLIIYTASWPIQRIGAWDTLLRARAIENQCYVAGVNRVGKDPDDIYPGHSAVVGYMGETLAGGIKWEESVITTELDIAMLDGFRERFPAWRDRDKFTIR